MKANALATANDTLAPPMSTRLWGLRWADDLPWRFEEVSVLPATFDDVLPFVAQNYGRIFGTAGTQARFLADPLTEAKRRFGAEMDVFQFRAPEGVIGVLMGHPTDWTTYYMRTVAILPEYRDRKLLTRFMERSYEPLRAVGVERIEGECSPANLPMTRMLENQGFMVTSTGISERWGYVLRYTKYLREEAEIVFNRQFCVAPPSQALRASGPAPAMKDLPETHPPSPPRRTS